MTPTPTPASADVLAVVASAEKFLAACNSAWSCGEPLHRGWTMLARADELQVALDALPDAVRAALEQSTRDNAKGEGL